MTASGHEAERARRPRWPWWVGGALVLAVVIALGAWLVTSWLGTARQAETVRAQASPILEAARDRDFAALSTLLPQAAADVRDLEARTSGLAWQVLTVLPVVGTDASAVSDLAFAIAPVLEAGVPLVDAAEDLLDRGLRREDGSIDIGAIADAAPGVTALSDALVQADAVLAPIDTAALRPELGGAVADVQEAVASAASTSQVLAESSVLVPQMLGLYGPRSWLLVLQNPAEARGSGGFPGGFVVLTADDGRLSVAQTGTSDDLYQTDIPAGVADADAEAMWGEALTRWNTYSRTPHFPTVGVLSQAGMAARGVDVQGVVAFDPATVAALLAASEPIVVEGREITADNVEKFFLEDVYREFPDAQERDRVSMAVVGAVLARFLEGGVDPLALAEALREPVDREKVRVWSADPEEQVWLEGGGLAGAVPTTDGPVVAVAFNNSAANKMDAFVTTRVVYRPGTCPTADVQTSTVELVMRNEAPEGLSNASGNYGRSDVPDAPEGSTSLVPYLYTPVNATFVSSAIDGVESTEVFGNGERGRAAYFANIGLDRGQERTVSVTFQEPTVAGVAPEVLTHGMARDTVVEIAPDPTCR